FSFGMIPERTDHFPTVAIVSRAKQTARQRAAPNDPRLVGAAYLQRPDARGTPRQRPAPRIVFFEAFRLRRIGRSCNLLPTGCGRAVHLDAEMAVIERRKVTAAARIRQREGDVVAEEIRLVDVPASVAAHDPEQPLPCRNQYRVVHGQPPDKAWNT